MTVADLLYESLGVFAEQDSSGDLLAFVERVTRPAEPVFDLVRERDDSPPWGVLLNVEECPAYALPYLAQYVGVVITPEMSEEQIRNEIREPTGWARGRVPAIQIAVRRTLDSAVENPLVIIRSRTPEVGRTYVRTLLSQTPDPDRTEAIVRGAVPAWNVLDYEAIVGVSFADVAASKYTTFAALAAAFPDFKHLTEALPGEL